MSPLLSVYEGSAPVNVELSGILLLFNIRKKKWKIRKENKNNKKGEDAIYTFI